MGKVGEGEQAWIRFCEESSEKSPKKPSRWGKLIRRKNEVDNTLDEKDG
jgi:hypothetical protein